MGLPPEVWWHMTPREFDLYVEGHKKRSDYELERLAWHVANVVNRIPHFGKGSRKPVTVDELLGREKPVFTDAKSFRAELKRRNDEREKREAGWY